MTFKLLDAAVLREGLPEHGLRQGDIGTIVEIHDVGAVEVEFLSPSGATLAVVTVPVSALRAAAKDEILTVRPHRRSA